MLINKYLLFVIEFLICLSVQPEHYYINYVNYVLQSTPKTEKLLQLSIKLSVYHLQI